MESWVRLAVDSTYFVKLINSSTWPGLLVGLFAFWLSCDRVWMIQINGAAGQSVFAYPFEWSTQDAQH
jgi:hypothetical protein